jgi:hypothetical protein
VEVLKVNDGMILLDQNELGFTSDKFDGYLWKKGNDILVSFIISKDEGKGNVRFLFDSILKSGHTVKVPTPFARMRMICERLGFRQEFEHDPMYGEDVELLVKDPAQEK